MLKRLWFLSKYIKLLSVFRLRLRDTFSRNTPPPGDPSGGVVYLRIVQRKHLNLWVIVNVFFYGEGLLAPRPTPKLEDYPSSAVHGCLFNLFTATLHIGGHSSIRYLRTRHAVVTGTHIHGIMLRENILFCNCDFVLGEVNESHLVLQ